VPPFKKVPDDCTIPYHFYKLFLDDSFINKVVASSRVYAAKKNRPDVVEKLTRDSIRVSQAIMHLSGYLSPSRGSCSGS